MLYFAKKIWPLVRPRLPDARFLIVGSEAPEAIRALDGRNNIKFVGYVPAVEPCLDAVRLTVAPIRYGAGMKGKVAVSLGSGTPCVLSAMAAEGMGLTHGHDVLIEDDAAAFADAVVRVYTDEGLWNALAKRGLEFVDRTYASRLSGERIRAIVALAES